MSFRERSAWVMAVVTALAGLWYFKALAALSATTAATPAPLGLLMRYVVIIVIASIVAQVVLAVRAPADAQAPADERERRVLARAGAVSGTVLAIGIVMAMAGFLANHDGNMLFHLAFFSLISAQVIEYLLQAIGLRRGS
jgi:uncharacterized membrane protein